MGVIGQKINMSLYGKRHGQVVKPQEPTSLRKFILCNNHIYYSGHLDCNVCLYLTSPELKVIEKVLIVSHVKKYKNQR